MSEDPKRPTITVRRRSTAERLVAQAEAVLNRAQFEAEAAQAAGDVEAMKAAAAAADVQEAIRGFVGGHAAMAMAAVAESNARLLARNAWGIADVLASVRATGDHRSVRAIAQLAASATIPLPAAELKQACDAKRTADDAQRAENEAAGAFLAERLGELRESLNLTQQEQQDLGRRLTEVRLRLRDVERRRDSSRPPPAKVDRAARSNPLLATEIAGLWALVEARMRESVGPDVELADPPERSYGVLCALPITHAPTLAELAGPLERVALAFVWPGVVRRWQRENAPRLAARLELAKLAEDEFAKAPEAEGRLAQAVSEVLPRVADVVRAPANPAHLGAAARDGMFLLDARLADALDEMPGCKPVAQEMRQKAAALFAKPTPAGEAPEWRKRWESPLRAAQLLARILWPTKVHPLFVSDRKPRAQTALVMAVHEPVMHLLSGAGRVDANAEDEQRRLRFNEELHVRLMPMVDVDPLRSLMVNRGLQLFGTVAAHKVFRWQVFTGHSQATDPTNSDPRMTRVEGGIEAFTHDHLGLKGGKAVEHVRDIIEAQHFCELPLPPDNRYSRLLMREVTPARRGQRSVLKMILGTALLPDVVHELRRAMGNSLAARRALRLVPVLDLPPFAGKRRNEYGAQATLSMAVVAYFRDHARELVKKGGVLLDLNTFAELARTSGVPVQTIGQILDRWTQDGDDAPAFLKRVDDEPHRYTLGDTHARAIAFLKTGGQKELNGQKGGEKATAARAEKLAALGKE